MVSRMETTRTDQLALVDGHEAYSTVDGCANLRELKVELRSLDGSLGEHDLCRGGVALGHRAVELELAGGVGPDGLIRAALGDLREAEGRGLGLDLGLGLASMSLVLARVHGEEELTLLHAPTALDMLLLKVTTHAGPNLHGLIGTRHLGDLENLGHDPLNRPRYSHLGRRRRNIRVLLRAASPQSHDPAEEQARDLHDLHDLLDPRACAQRGCQRRQCAKGRGFDPISASWASATPDSS